MTIEPTPPRRRWFQFSLATMFVVLTAFAIWLGWELKVSRSRDTARGWINAHGGVTMHGPRLQFNLMRDWQESNIWLPERERATDLTHIQAAFPEATISFHSDGRMNEVRKASSVQTSRITLIQPSDSIARRRPQIKTSGS